MYLVMVVVWLALVGCQTDLAPTPRAVELSGNWAQAFNRSLYYLPFAANRAACGDSRADLRRVVEGSSIRLMPGMKLVIHSTNANVPRDKDVRGNAQPPIVSAYEWTVPEYGPDNVYASTDFFMLAELLSAWTEPKQLAPTDPGVDMIALFRKTALALPEETFDKDIGSKLLCPVVSTLRLSSRNELATDEPLACTAKSIRMLFGPGSHRELQKTAARQTLTFANPLEADCPTLQVYAGSPAYFDQPTSPLGRQRNAYLDFEARTSSTYVEPLIAVRIEPEAMSRHVPVYWSVEDLERRLGVRVLAVRRRLDFLGATETSAGRVDCVGWAPAQTAACGACAAQPSAPAKSSDSTLCGDLAAVGNYATIFVRPRLRGGIDGLGARLVLGVGYREEPSYAKARADMLLAHGDVIVTERSAATDAPGMR